MRISKPLSKAWLRCVLS